MIETDINRLLECQMESIHGQQDERPTSWPGRAGSRLG